MTRNNKPASTTTFRNFLLACSIAVSAQAQAEWVEWVGDASATVKYRYNLNFSDFDEVAEEDWVAETRASYGRYFQAAESTRIGIIGHATGLLHERYDKLNGLITGLDLVGIHKFGLGATNPVARLSVTAENLDIRDHMRDGRRYAASLALSKRFTERLDGNIGVTHSDRKGHRGAFSGIAGQNTDVFSQQQWIFNVGGSYLLTERMLTSFTYSRLDGEFATQCPDVLIGPIVLANPEINGAAADSVFGGACTYRVDGEVDTYDLGASYFLDDTTSVEFGYQFRSGEAGNLDYTSYDISMGISMLF